MSTDSSATIRECPAPRVLPLLLVLLALLVAPAAADATPSSAAVDALNKVRAQVGVAPVVNDEALASSCKVHSTWMRLNSMLMHGEVTGSNGFTAKGNEAGMSSVLFAGFEFKPQTTPETIHWLRGSPLHLVQLLHPGLVRSGYGFDGTYACMFTLDPFFQPEVVVHDRTIGRDQVFTWPPDKATDVPSQENTSGENPSPNLQVGLPQTQTTGPYLLVYGNGFGALTACNEIKILSAKLVGPGGAAVKVRSWDDVKSGGGVPGGCRVPAGSGYIVPELPLKQRTTYTATVELVGALAPIGTAPKVHTWSFTTAGTPDTAKPVVRNTLKSLLLRGNRVAYRFLFTAKDASPTTCTAVLAGRTVACAVKRGAISVAGLRSGTPRSLSLTLVVRDSAGNRTRLVVVARRA